MSSYELNKMFSISKLVPLLFKGSLLRLQFYIGFVFLLSMNPMFLLLHAYLKILFTLMASSFKLSFRQWSRYYYYLFCNGEPILVCCQQLFHGLFSVFKSLMPHVLLSFPTLFNCKNDFWFYVISSKCRTTNSFSLADISQPFIFLIESPTRTFTFFVLLPILWFPFRWWIWNSRA